MPNDLATLNAKLTTQLSDASHAAWASAEKDDLVTWAVADLFPRYVVPIDPTTTIIDLVDDQFYYTVPSTVVEVNRVERFVGGAQLTTSLAADDIIDTTTKHDFVAGQAVRFTTLTGGSGLSADTTYYVIAANLADTTFQVSTTLGGSAVNFTTNITAGVVERVGGDEHGSLATGTWSTEGNTFGTLKLRIAPFVVAQGGTLRLHGFGRYDVTTNLIPDHLVPLVLATARLEALHRAVGEAARFEQWQNADPTQMGSINQMLAMIDTAERDTMRLRATLQRSHRRPVPARLGS